MRESDVIIYIIPRKNRLSIVGSIGVKIKYKLSNSVQYNLVPYMITGGYLFFHEQDYPEFINKKVRKFLEKYFRSTGDIKQ